MHPIKLHVHFGKCICIPKPNMHTNHLLIGIWQYFLRNMLYSLILLFNDQMKGLHTVKCVFFMLKHSYYSRFIILL